ncbi:MAG TPA: YigZ family protein [Lentimicrobium sp.]|nr:YigZ family protein [Lentimicrobium sp.]
MLFEDTYKTIELPSSGIYKEKGSKFLSFAFPVKNETEIKSTLEQIKKEYFDASHHCFAYVIGYDKSGWRINDDGEPSGTAGRPIYGQIQSFDLTNVLIVVVRYFGGIKLGVGGLITAYKVASQDALNNAKIVDRTINEIYRLEFTYEQVNEAMKLVKEFGLQILESNFDTRSYIVYKIRRNLAQKVISKSEGIYRFKVIYISTE